MLVVGLTGGIGSGKSTLAELLSERGAVVIDADSLGHQALAPGEPTWHSVVDQFGDGILAAGSMEIDRKALGRIVFADPAKRAALNAITHPFILRRIADSLEAFENTSEIVVLDAALIVELGLSETLDAVVVVASDIEVRRARLMTDRGMTSDAVDARIAAQARPEDLFAKADIVVTNDGSIADLTAEADRVWAELQERTR
jgi:dephospho-CoA kinase